MLCHSAQVELGTQSLHPSFILSPLSLFYFLYFRDIAQAIKYLLDAVNDAFTQINSLEDRNLLDRKKRDFVKYSKKFSTTLKDFFRDNRFVSIYT